MTNDVLRPGIHAEARGANGKESNMMKSVSLDAVVADLEAHPKKRIFWRSGWAYRGAREREISRAPHEPKTVLKNDGSDGCRMVPTLIRDWKDELKACFRWACVVEMDANTDSEMHLNGLSCNDME